MLRQRHSIKLYFYGNSFNPHHLNRFTPLILSVASGILLWAAWPVSPQTMLIFIAFIPLLWLETIVKRRRTFFGYTYITMLIWNVATTWWIWNASVPGALAAFLANSLLMCFPWLGFRIVKKWFGDKPGYASLLVFWMCFEYIHLQDWGLSWPWLTLGNVFATRPQWVQWYEYTGTSGGTFWVLLVNLFLFFHLKENLFREARKTYKNLLIAVGVLLIPILSSRLVFTNLFPASNNNIVIAQPNIDPYEKISDMTGSFESQIQKLISWSEKNIDTNTSLVVWPETALYMGNGIDERNMKENYFLNPLWAFLQRHPQISLFTGVESYRIFDSATKYSNAFNTADGKKYVEYYNGSALLDSSGPMGFYHKSMLVPGVETLPWFLHFLDKWFDKFGGTTAGYAKQKDRTVLVDKHGWKIAPAICYESIYGEYMSKYVRKGANLICVITNDGWWKKTPGHKQHMNYARLRAIETRTWVARSANTGISCFIDPNGTVIEPQPYGIASSIKLSFSPRQSSTFFVRYGDIISKIASVLSAILLLLLIYRKLKKRFFSPHSNIGS